MAMGHKRKNYSGEEKVKILRRHLIDHVAVSDLCDEYGLNPNVFYRWQKEFFEKGAAAFERKGNSSERKLTEEVSRLQTKLAHKDEVIAAIMEEQMKLKKSLGEL
jgi:transposase